MDNFDAAMIPANAQKPHTFILLDVYVTDSEAELWEPRLINVGAIEKAAPHNSDMTAFFVRGEHHLVNMSFRRFVQKINRAAHIVD